MSQYLFSIVKLTTDFILVMSSASYLGLVYVRDYQTHPSTENKHHKTISIQHTVN